MTDNTAPQSELIPTEQLAPTEIAELDLYKKREKIYTRRIEGLFQRVRLYTGWPLLLGYFLLPWINWNGQQSVLFDLPARKFHILGLTLWPQDFPLLAWLLIIAAWGLFAVTVWVGRVWCGYTCPQTVWTAIFMWAEQVAEGSRNQRIKLDQTPLDANKVLRKAAKHGMWFGFAFLTGFTFVGYFSPIRELAVNFATFDIGFWEGAWTLFFTSATYINAGWMREQICLYMCPYARFQSVMFDKNTLTVSYDKKRGEPRGTRKKGVDPKSAGLGDCIDCEICVQVCPTGIDIRNGLQYECINCALCVDGCNSVMDKMGYPRGLIRYATENELEGKPRKLIHPRLIGYTIGIAIMAGLFTYTLLTRVPVGLDVLRDRNRLYRETGEGLIENSYTLKLLNKANETHVYRVSLNGLDGAEMVGKYSVTVGSGEVIELPLRVHIDPTKLKQRKTDVEFAIQAIDDPKLRASSASTFVAPIGHME
jgi:cytochrome c oxidase accessory protein FixG